MAEFDTREIAGVVAQALQKNPDLVERFKSHPHETIEGVSGVNGLSATDMGGILNTMLSGSNEGGGMLASILSSLLGGSKTASGEHNIVGDLIKQVMGGGDSQDIIGSVIGSLLSGGSSAQREAAQPAPKSSSSSSSKPKASSKKEEPADDLLGTIGGALGGGGIDIGDLVGTLLSAKRK
ncbi:MAG: hypothetical protein FWG24_03495 [Eggerthellaceae bacterium]|nr:hypothetical protein [Eggerthellaceae bacterium]